ncbi:MAG: hypothetical protein WDN69_11795 [Aliidongia sp.]
MKATNYDLTAPLNRQSFAHDFTFRSVIAQCRFDGNQLAEIDLHPVEDEYGAPLTESGIPRLVTDEKMADSIIRQITDQTSAYGLPPLHLARNKASPSSVLDLPAPRRRRNRFHDGRPHCPGLDESRNRTPSQGLSLRPARRTAESLSPGGPSRR